MVRSKIERKRKIIEDRKKNEGELTSKRRKITNEVVEKLDEEEKSITTRPDELKGLIFFLLIPNIAIPFVSFVTSIIFLISLMFLGDPIFYIYLYIILMYLISATLTGLACYWLYQLKKFSYYLGIGISVFNLIVNINVLFSLNLIVIIMALIIIVFNGISLYFLVFYQEIRDALKIGK